MMYNPTVQKAFQFTSADSQRYGSSGFGNACLVAKQVLAANQGTRFVLISFGSWDMHQDIYGQANPKGNNLYTMGKPLDDGYSALLSDLKASGQLDSTLVVMVGEFGRTVGPLSAAGGRDHWLQQSAVFAGAGIKGGKTIGATTADGAATADPGWSRNRASQRRGHRSHHLLRHGHRLDHRPPRRPLRPRLRICALQRPESLRPDRRAVEVR